MGEQTDAPIPSHDPPAADVGKAWIHAARQSDMRACRDLGSSNRPTKPAPRLLTTAVYLHRFMQITAAAGPPDSRLLLERQRGLVLFFSAGFFLAGHFLLDPISFGSLSMPNRCRVSESTRLPEPGLECIWPAPGNGGALPVQGPKLGIPRRRIGRSFDGFQGQLFLGVLWGGGRCRLSFFFPSFSWSSSRGCVETTTSTTSIPGPVTPLPIETRGRS